jgi:hypothetical protein
MEADRAQEVSAKPPRELPKERVVDIGSHPLDHELVLGGTERQRASFLQQVGNPVCYVHCGGLWRRMPGRIHSMLMDGDRKIYEKFA